MRLKPLTRLDAGSALHWELARTDTFSEPTVLPGREQGQRVTNPVSSGDIRPQTLYGDCKDPSRIPGGSWHSSSCFKRAGRAMLLIADKERTCSSSL